MVLKKKLLGATASESMLCFGLLAIVMTFALTTKTFLMIHCYGKGDVETATPSILLTITHVFIFMLACDRVCMYLVNTRASC